MFRKFSLFDSSPPPSKISIAPPKPNISNNKSQRKSGIKSVFISPLQLSNAAHDLTLSVVNSNKKQPTRRSKSLDHSNNNDGVKHVFHSPHYINPPKSATLPPVINRDLPQSAPTTNRWYYRFGNSIRRGAWSRRGIIYEVNLSKIDAKNIIVNHPKKSRLICKQKQRKRKRNS
jgi:hypothetical protein